MRNNNTTTRATLATTTAFQDALRPLALALQIGTLDDIETAMAALDDAARAAGYEDAGQVRVLALAICNAEDHIEARVELAKIEEEEDEADPMEPELDLPSGWTVDFRTGHLTGAATAAVLDENGDTATVLAYWEDADDINAAAWSAYEAGYNPGHTRQA